MSEYLNAKSFRWYFNLFLFLWDLDSFSNFFQYGQEKIVWLFVNNIMFANSLFCNWWINFERMTVPNIIEFNFWFLFTIYIKCSWLQLNHIQYSRMLKKFQYIVQKYSSFISCKIFSLIMFVLYLHHETKSWIYSVGIDKVIDL